MKRILLLLGCLGVLIASPLQGAQNPLPSFPGAEGFGAFTPGGRGGKVLFVTTLEDYEAGKTSIPGSFRAAVEAKGPRIILFRVSGTIYLKRALTLREPYATIAGQSAPGDGICIARNLFRLATHDVVIRYLRFRLGDEMRGELDTFEISDSQNVIVDHCSISWSMDENCTLHGEDTRNVTVQWSIVAESLNRSFHPKGEHGHGSLLRSKDGGFSIHHSIYAHNHARNPRPGGYEDEPGLLLDFRNNVVYDWGEVAGYSGLERTRLNYVGNYFKAGPSTDRSMRTFGFSAKTPRTKIFAEGNFLFGAPQKTADNSLLIRKWGEWEGDIKDTNLVPEAFPAPPITTDTSEKSFEKVLADAGATLPKRDSTDARLMDQIRSGKGRIIDSQKEVGGWPELKSGPVPADSDNDGMPDDWENKFTLDSSNAADGARDLDGDGYMNIEEFLNATDPQVSDRKGPGFDLNAIHAKIDTLNAAARAEIAEEKRSRPPEARADTSAPPPLQRMELRPASNAPPRAVVVAFAGGDSLLQFNWIPAGRFLMGSPKDEPERDDEERQHEVTISRSFYMGATLVTEAEYQMVMNARTVRGREANWPVEATWPDAVRFCEALSKNTGRVFRLPTEAEWEYACRAGTTTPFNTGKTISTDQANFDGKFVYSGGNPGIYRQSPTPVRTFAPNAWGLYDMHGNAYQWCSDWYGPYPKGAVTDPHGVNSGSNRVIRGGKYGSGPRYIRSAARYRYNPDNSSVVFGFRVVMEAGAEKN